MTATSGSRNTPDAAPIAVTIKPTSPRETMPQPTRKLRTGPIPRAKAATPHPSNLLTTAIKKIAPSSSQCPPRERKLLDSPIETKNSGIKRPCPMA